MVRWRAVGVVALGLVGVGACDDPGDEGVAEIPWRLAPLGEMPQPADNPTTPEKAELGRLLFYDPVLGSDGETACATCHSEIWGMGDGLARSVGVGGGTLTGPGRTGPNETRRNAPTLWNVGWRSTLFWDGREPSLEAQALAPMHSEVELARAPEAVIAEIASIPEYVARFEAAFPDEDEAVSVSNLARALAAFQRTLDSRGALFDAYAAGDVGALHEEEVEGMWLFAEAGCDGCHAPPLFASEVLADRGIGDPSVDAGRGEITGLEADIGRFRTPTLRNVRDSEPYFHDGSVATLEEAVRHEVGLSEVRQFDAVEIANIYRFVQKALVDTRYEPDRPDAVPSGLPVPEDGFRIPR